MTLLADVLNPTELATAVETGLVRGKDYRPVLWRHARPAADFSMTKVTDE